MVTARLASNSLPRMSEQGRKTQTQHVEKRNISRTPEGARRTKESHKWQSQT